MTQFDRSSTTLNKMGSENSIKIPNSFAEAVLEIKNFAIEEIDKQTKKQQLYYHNYNHANAVEQRATKIYQEILPFWDLIFQDTPAPDPIRTKQIIDICAISHDMVQVFVPTANCQASNCQGSRKRETGVSETATVIKLMDYIQGLNNRYSRKYPDRAPLFTKSDLQVIRQAITATICLFDTSNSSIYQPELYNPGYKIPLEVRIIALSDLGGLGIEGIQQYFAEGILLFLEDNPEMVTLIKKNSAKNYNVPYSFEEAFENLRKTLLKRAKFQVDFAKGRVARIDRELEGLPSEVISVLKKNVFQYLNEQTIKEIESITPTNPDTSLEELIEFFDLEKYIDICSYDD